MSDRPRIDGRRKPPAPVLAVSRLIRRTLILVVRLYQLTLSPFIGNQCRFFPSCSNYAIDTLRLKPAWKAIGLILWRVARCQPFCKGGFDPVKEEPWDEWYRF